MRTEPAARPALDRGTTFTDENGQVFAAHQQLISHLSDILWAVSVYDPTQSGLARFDKLLSECSIIERMTEKFENDLITLLVVEIKQRGNGLPRLLTIRSPHWVIG